MRGLEGSPVTAVGSLVLRNKVAGDLASVIVKSSGLSTFESDYLYLTD